MENNINTGMIMDAVSQPESQIKAKDNLDAAVGVKQEQLMEAMARYKAAHTPLIKEYKIGRNDPCPCGSGLKFKKCCINKLEYNKYIS